MRFTKTIRLNVPAQFAFDWHARPGALYRLLPPWEDIRILQESKGIQVGERVIMTVPMGPTRKKWIAEHTDYQEGREFQDVQVSGPFASWKHRHIFRPIDQTTCEMTDEVNYELPFGPLGKLGSSFATSKLNAMFTYRHARTATELDIHYEWRDVPRKRILISGSSGLIGTSLVSFLRTGGHEVIRLVRDKKEAENNPQAIFWDIKAGEIDREKLENLDAVIHLAGAGIADHSWTKEYKETIKQSRVESTKLLATSLASLQNKPEVFISTSAVGYYGNRGDEVLTEDSTSGVGFLPEVAREWEEAAEPAKLAGIRIVHPRLGVVLTPAGAALQKMLTPFKLGAGGVVGPGSQYWSTISIHDVVGIYHYCMMKDSIHGPVNAVIPQETTNKEFIKTLGRVLHRPTIAPLPSVAVKMMLGEMGKPLLLDSTRVQPRVLIEHGYRFQTETLEQTLRQVLGRF